MTVTIDYAQLAGSTDSCLPEGRSRADYEMSQTGGGGRDILLIPGNSVSMQLRVTAGDPIEVLDISATGAIETETVHGLSVGDPIHICFYSGIAKTPVSPYLQVKTVVDDHHFTLEDKDGVEVILKRESILPATATQPKLCGWVARAANLKGFHGAMVFDLDTGRRNSMLGAAAIKAGSEQMQIRGAHDLKAGDVITLGGFRSKVQMAMAVNTEQGCFTIVQMGNTSTKDIKFTDGIVATNCPNEPVMQALGEGDSWGWVNVTMPGKETRQLEALRKPTENGCPQFVGKFRYELRGVTVTYPSWFRQCQDDEPTWQRVFDYGNIWI